MFFGLLGPLDVRDAEGISVSVGGPRVRTLLALLLLDTGRVIPAETLIDGVYGAEPPGDAGNALQSQVSRLRGALKRHFGPGVGVEARAGGYRLVADRDTVDAHRFERLAREGRAALDAQEFEEAAGLLARAVGLWRGPALADLPHAAPKAARLEELRAAAQEDHAEALLALGAWRDAVPELRALVAAHPLRERPRGQLMRALDADGRQAEALQVFEQGRALLADELGADPSAELAAVHLAILRGETRRAPAPQAAPKAASRVATDGQGTADGEGVPHGSLPAPWDAKQPLVDAASVGNAASGPSSDALPGTAAAATLPTPLTTFIGRDAELARVAELTSTARLVTLLGPGGAGKTRLALEAARRSPGEVRLAEFGPTADTAALPHVIAAALGLRDVAGAPGDPVDRLVTALADRPLLLVLDNCEHVVAATAALAHRLLLACPGLRVLATSREPLGVTGETLCPVPPLGLPAAPPPGHATEPSADGARAYADRVREAPSVRLFADRAAAVRPGFTVDAANALAVARICTALDGLPLALELAAARLRTLEPGEIAGRLDDRFRLLSRGSRTASPRHRTLEAVVEWSWDLLDPGEQALARRLTVFTGGATREAVADVCGVDPYETEELLTDLVDKSLVTLIAADPVDPVDPVDRTGQAGRADQVGQVNQAGQADQAGQAGRAHPAGAPGTAAGHDAQARTTTRYGMLETVRAFGALRLAEAGEEEPLRRAHARHFLDLATDIAPRLRGSGQLAALALLTREKANLEAALRWATGADPGLALRLHAALSWSWWLGGTRNEWAPSSVALLEAVGPEPPEGLEEEYALCAVNAFAALDGRPAAHGPLHDPQALFATAGRIMSALRRPLSHPPLMVQWGLVAGPNQADWEAHRAQLGTDRWSHAVDLLGQGYARFYQGDHEGAAGDLGRAAGELREVGDRWALANVLDPLAQLAEWEGDHAAAVALLNEALALVEELGSVEDVCDLLCRRADLALGGGRPEAAREDYARAERTARAAAVPLKVRAALRGLGDVARASGENAAAARLYRQVLHGGSGRVGGDPGDAQGAWFHETRAWAAIGLGRIAEAEGDPNTARRRHLSALDHVRGEALWPTLAVAAAVEGLARVAVSTSDGVRAAALLGAASAIRGPLPADPDDVAAVEDRARALAGDQAYTLAWDRTAALPRDEALGAALAHA